MSGYLLIGGATCALLAVGHAAIGLRWVLPELRRNRLTATPFGPPSLTLGMVVFTWHVVTVMLAAFAALLIALGAGAGDPRSLTLQWVGGVFAADAALALWRVRRRPTAMVRFPVPLLIALVAAMALAAA